MAEKLKLLYKDPLNYNEVALTVARRNIVLSAYHFDFKNNLSVEQPQPDKKKFDLVHSETSDSMTHKVPKLYCWILKAAIAIHATDKFVPTNENLLNDECRSENIGLKLSKYHWRVIFEMCTVHHLVTDKKYVILAIMTTMCKDRRHDFMVKEMDCDTINIWQDLTEVKFCYALPDVEIDYEHCHQLRMHYWLERSFFYDPLQKIPIDTKLSLRAGKLDDQFSYERTSKNQNLNEVTFSFYLIFLVTQFKPF